MTNKLNCVVQEININNSNLLNNYTDRYSQKNKTYVPQPLYLSKRNHYICRKLDNKWGVEKDGADKQVLARNSPRGGNYWSLSAMFLLQKKYFLILYFLQTGQ